MAYLLQLSLSFPACPAGLYGDRCSRVCECRDISECSTITGQCDCQPGYSGITCHDECLEGFYGQNCSLECNCNSNGTMLCHHINGTCICQDQWMGVQCEFESMDMEKLIPYK